MCWQCQVWERAASEQWLRVASERLKLESLLAQAAPTIGEPEASMLLASIEGTLRTIAIQEPEASIRRLADTCPYAPGTAPVVRASVEESARRC